MLSAERLTKSYGDVTVVSDATLALRAGELAAIVGRSGSGKSTLLMLLGSWLQADAGILRAPSSWAGLAYVPQRFGLVPELTVGENVALPARLGRTDGAAPNGSNAWISRRSWIATRTRSRSASSNASQSRARCAFARACCSSTSRRRTRTVRRPSGYGARSLTRPRRGRRVSSRRTSPTQGGARTSRGTSTRAG